MASTLVHMSKLVNRSGLAGISTSTGTAPHTAKVVFSKELAKPVSVCTEAPLRAPCRHAFEVYMPIKQGHTAVGYTANEPTSEYLTPDFGLGTGGYISMGGAGNIYPQVLPTPGTYAQGDRVRVELELSPSGSGTVTYAVNGRVTGQVPWTEGSVAFPTISCKSGEVVCEVQFFHSDGPASQ